MNTRMLPLPALASVLLVPLVASLVACSGGGGGGGGTTVNPQPGEATASGTLDLFGADTGAVGNTLTVGDVARITGPGATQTYYFIAQDARVSGFEYSINATPSGVFQNTTVPDINNTFVMNVIDFDPNTDDMGISMTIRVQGVDYDYTCTFCTGLTIDPGARMVDFDNVEVLPQGAAVGPLTLDGTLIWQTQ